MVRGSRGSKCRLAKTAGAESCGQRRNENCTVLWREAHFQVKMHKTHQVRRCGSTLVQNTPGSDHVWKLRCGKMSRPCGAKDTFKSKLKKTDDPKVIFGRCGVKKWRAAVARSTCASRNVKKLTVSGHFSKVGCQKLAHRCGAKHIYNSKC